MENKINIAELLKDCPMGMELDCTVYDNVIFENINDWVYPIRVKTKDGSKSLNLTKYGCTSENENAKCIIFPKGKTTWEGFHRPFKDGDILTTNIGSIFIFSHLELDSLDDRNICKAYVGIRNTIPISLFHTEQSDIFGPYESLCKLATEEEKQELFNAIKINGYKWNVETKTLEKLPRFKVGNRIKLNNSSSIYTIIDLLKDRYRATINSHDLYEIEFERQDAYQLVPDKFDISTLIPFESRVLVRDKEEEKWKPAIWGYYDANTGYYPYEAVGGNCFYLCIPYEGNQHLLGTTNDCDDYFRIWKDE